MRICCRLLCSELFVPSTVIWNWENTINIYRATGRIPVGTNDHVCSTSREKMTQILTEYIQPLKSLEKSVSLSMSYTYKK